MEFNSSARATLFCANKLQLYQTNTVAKSCKITFGMSKLSKVSDKAK